MIPGPEKVIECPTCGELARFLTLISGNTLGARFWTDGQMNAPMLPRFPVVTRCQRCNQFYWISDANVLGEIDQFRSDPEYNNAVSPKWLNAKVVRALEADEYIDYLEDGSVREHNRIIVLRLLAWRKENDKIRYSDKTNEATLLERGPAHRANMEQLMHLLQDDEPEERLMKAELARELGLFEESLRLLQYDFPDKGAAQYVDMIQRMAMQHNTIIAEIPRRG